MVYHTVGDIDSPDLPELPKDVSVETALEEMFGTGNPQVGITRDDDLVGVVSYRTVARALLICSRMEQTDSFLGQSIDVAIERSFPAVSADDELFVLFDVLADSPYVVIEGDGDSHSILRDVGFHQFLKRELEEFLVIEEIERTIRDILRDACDDVDEQVRETFATYDNLRTPDSLEGCSFRHYSVFVSANWATVEEQFDHKQDFVRELVDRVGDIRNQTFHFRSGQDGEGFDMDFLQFAREHLGQLSAER